MPSPRSAGAAMLLLCCAVALAQSPEREPVPAPPAAPTSGSPAPSREDIAAAVAKLRADPNLGSEHRMRTLHWVDRSSPPPPTAPAWIAGLVEYIGLAGRLVMWLAGAVVFAIAAVWLFKFLKAHSPKVNVIRNATASHVGQLDIRPASLPDDVGAAALALLDAGSVRDALSLLYRGALSRAVHRFGVTVQESYTEGEALRAVDAGLDESRAQYFKELVDLWQRAVYAGQIASTTPVAALCSRFEVTLGGSP